MHQWVTGDGLTYVCSKCGKIIRVETGGSCEKVIEQVNIAAIMPDNFLKNTYAMQFKKDNGTVDTSCFTK
jgi:hypothetical protein